MEYDELLWVFVMEKVAILGPKYAFKRVAFSHKSQNIKRLLKIDCQVLATKNEVELKADSFHKILVIGYFTSSTHYSNRYVTKV